MSRPRQTLQKAVIRWVNNAGKYYGLKTIAGDEKRWLIEFIIVDEQVILEWNSQYVGVRSLTRARDRWCQMFYGEVLGSPHDKQFSYIVKDVVQSSVEDKWCLEITAYLLCFDVAWAAFEVFLLDDDEADFRDTLKRICNFVAEH